MGSYLLLKGVGGWYGLQVGRLERQLEHLRPTLAAIARYDYLESSRRPYLKAGQQMKEMNLDAEGLLSQLSRTLPASLAIQELQLNPPPLGLLIRGLCLAGTRNPEAVVVRWAEELRKAGYGGGSYNWLQTRRIQASGISNSTRETPLRMTEWSRRERNLTSGLMVQVVFVGIAVFLFTQALRQLKYQHSEYLELRKQIKACLAQAARGRPDVSSLEAEVARLKDQWASLQEQDQWADRLVSLAQKRFEFDDLKVRLSRMPKKMVKVPSGEEPALPLETLTLQLVGIATTRSGAGLMASVWQMGLGFSCPLRSMTIKATDLKKSLPVQFQLEWMVPFLQPQGDEKKEAAKPAKEPVFTPPALSWGLREEPFLTPFLYTGVLHTPPESLKGMRLMGIQWLETGPVCLINDKVVRLNERVGAYQLVLVTPRAALLQGEEEEVFLPLSTK